jgi:hypothetical protein
MNPDLESGAKNRSNLVFGPLCEDDGSGVVSGTKKFPFLVLIRTFFGSNFCLFEL